MAQPGPRSSRPDDSTAPVAPSADVPGVASGDGPTAPAAGSAAAGEATPAAGSTTASATTPAGKATLSPAEIRALKFTARNMVWSLLPLTVLILVMVGWAAVRQPDDPVHPVEIDSSLFLVSQRADYPLLVPQGLPAGWQPTSVRTDAGAATDRGTPVTLQIGWFTAGEEYAGYVISDAADARALTAVLDGATDAGTAQVGGTSWRRLTTARGETALTRTQETTTLLVTGSASEEELETLAGAVRPYRAP
jgi:Protein of unknown function (DUF4245)